MRIAIQCSDLDHARIDGTRVYLKELLKRFGELAPHQEFLIYHKGTFNPSLTPPDLPNYTVETYPFPFAWMQTRFAYQLFHEKPEKLFLPIQAAPLVLPGNIEVTATIHDLAFKRYPETFPKKDLWKLNLMLAVAVRRADKLIAVSQSTKNDLLEYFPHLSESKIKVIHHGFDGAFFEKRLSDDELHTTLSKHGLKKKSYALYVGALQPRKNLVRLVQAFEQAKKSMFEMKLVLAGESAWLAEDLHRTIEESPYKKDIILTGRVTFEELRALYQGARLFAFPSLYEGFGLPLLEAFASGIPVLTASNSSLVEVAGKAALYCHAESVPDIAQKLERLWDDEALQKELIERGTRQLQIFSWEKCAQETLEYIEKGV